jgi:hypothetical protein
MKNIPRILPLVGIAMGGVLAVNALAGAKDFPQLVSGARAFAEEAAKAAKGSVKGESAEPEAKADDTKVVDGSDASLRLPPSAKPAAVCAPTAAELAKEAGLSPAELQVLQSLGARRGQLDQREQDLDVQLALMAAAEAKLDAKLKSLNGLKADVQGLMTQADAKEEAEINRLVKVFEGMKAKDAAPRMVLLDDKVRIPIAAKMKERALSAILAQMPAPEAIKLTEALARRYAEVREKAAQAQQAANDAKAEPAKPVPAKQAAAPANGPAAKQAAAKPAPAAPKAG